MHDLERIMAEVDAGESEGEAMFGGSAVGEETGETPLDEIFQETDNESDRYEVDQQEAGDQGWSGYESPAYDAQEDSPLSEVDEMALATELLGVTDEAELDQFLGKVFKRAWRGARRVARDVVRPLGKTLKGVARRALPMLGGAVGTAFGGPLGGALGGQLASGAGQMFGLEVEGLSGEDRDYEVARRFVRLASSSAGRAARANPSNPRAAVRSAVQAAARRHAPGLLRRRVLVGGTVGALGVPGAQRGTWVRRGRAIILLDV